MNDDNRIVIRVLEDQDKRPLDLTPPTKKEMRAAARDVRRALRPDYSKYWEAFIDCGFMRMIRYVFFTPLSVGARVVASVARVIGFLSALGMPYGFYCLYRLLVEWHGGADLGSLDWSGVRWFIVLPVTGYFIHYVFDKLSGFFDLYS